jgi:hypothetical protein
MERITSVFPKKEKRKKQRLGSLQLLEAEIDKLQRKIPRSRRSSSCLDAPDPVYTRSPTPIGEGEEEINGYLTNRIIEILPIFPEDMDEAVL